MMQHDDSLVAYCLYPVEDAYREVTHDGTFVYAVTTISPDPAPEGYVYKKLYHVPLKELVDWMNETTENIVIIGMCEKE